MRKSYFAFNEIKNIILNRYEEVGEMLETFEKEYAVKISVLGNPKTVRHKDEEGLKLKASNPNHDLIRLLKK
jgi:hypothetical protein